MSPILSQVKFHSNGLLLLLYGYCTRERIGDIVYFINIVALMPKLPEQNCTSTDVDLFDRFIRPCCLDGLFDVV